MNKTIYDEKRQQWHGLEKRPFYNPEATLGDVLLRSMHIFGHNIAQINDNSGVQLTYAEMREKTIRAALNLKLRGYKEKQVFTIIAKNSEYVAPIAFASFCIGCPINPLATLFGNVEIIHMLNITKPSLVFCDADIHDKVLRCLQEVGNDAKIITFNGKVGDSEQVEDLFVEIGGESKFVSTPFNGDESIAAILCSSGTTGLPKGVSLSHASLLAQTNVNLDIRDVVLNFSELYWLSGVYALLCGALHGATRIITTETFTPILSFRIIEQYKVSTVYNATHQMISMLKHEAINQADLTSIKLYLVGGSKVPFGTAAEFNKYFPNGETVIGIGMTEISGGYAMVKAKNCTKDSVGQLSSNVVVKIVDEDGNRCGVNVDGEICLKKESIFLGYYNKPEATKEAFDAEGFFLTGDIGHFDEDGDIFIVDRKKDLLKYCNCQVTPTEIEDILLRSPEIETVCVVGIPDIIVTDLPAVAVIRKQGSQITAGEIYDMIADKLADQYKLRGGVYFVESLPTTASGKILRREVKDILIKRFNEQMSLE